MAQPSPYAEPLVTGEAVAVELSTAGVGSRAVAVAVDFAIQLAVGTFVLWLVVTVLPSVDIAAAQAILLTAVVLLTLGYPVAFETLGRGRTPGKAVMGLRVLRDDGGPIRFRHAFVRGLVGVVVERPGLFAFLPALLCILLNRRSKRLGDLAAGTVVVQERVPARLAQPPQLPPALAGWAAGLDLSQLPDALALEVRQFLGRRTQLAPWARDELEQRLATAVAGAVGPPPPATHPSTFLATVLGERRRRELERLQPPANAAAAQPAAPPPDLAPPEPRQPDPAPPVPPPEPPPGRFAPPA